MIPTGELTDPATIGALLDRNPWDGEPITCEGECGNTAERAHFDAATARFVALCPECEPIPFTLVDGS